MTLVVDASVTLGWLFADERTPAVDALLDRVAEDGAVVPGLWALEVANALQTALRRGRIDAGFRDQALALLSRLCIAVDGETASRAWGDTQSLADRFGLTLYDAAYLELAMRKGLPLATTDQQLRDAAVGAGVLVM